MIKKQWNIQDKIFWQSNHDIDATCRQDQQVDVVIIGGGMAGLSAAQAWHKRGKKVVLLEQFDCGGGATGKSSGFVTPNAELSLTDFIHRYNFDTAHALWNFISSGVEDIRANIEQYNFDCDYQSQDTLILANALKDLKRLEVEHDNLAKIGYNTQFYNQSSVKSQIGSDSYYGGVAYQGTFGMNGYQYCQALKKHLQSVGVLIFEQTPVLKIENHNVITAHAVIIADYIVVCTDRFMPELQLLKQDVYHGQTFVMASQVLPEDQIRTLFPDKNLMAWDTDFIYNYFRVTGDNRLLLGGGNLASTYSSKACHDYQPMIKKLTDYCAQHFPLLDVQFECMWPGLMGISKDVGPIAGSDKNKPYLFYVTAATGLPIAAALGRYSAENLIDGNHDFDICFSPYRKFPISGLAQSILGNKLSFALSNLIKTNIP